MHNKIIASLLVSSTLCFSQQLDNEKFQILAQNINSLDSTITASGDVVVFSPTYYLSANKIVYDKSSDSFELFDNVVIIKDNTIQTQSDYAFLNLKNESLIQNPIFLQDSATNLWLSSKSSKKENSLIELENSIISSCNCVDPAWSIKVSSASYDTEEKWLNTYNTRLYLGAVPIFYTPYFGFPTDKSRRTGLLIPTIGYSKDDGVYYAQPIYFAPQSNYDLEIIPQIRSKRGYGIYNYFRYADSPYSLLKIQTGGFIENKDYQREQNLENQKHYGWNIDYERLKLFSKDEDQDGLYASLNYMNDIEYKTLEKEEENISTDKKIESKINYFYNTPRYYAALYARYYIDTQAANNDNTLQELPQLQFHKYNNEALFDGLLYSFDTKVYNYTRQTGLTANIYEMTIPLSYTKYFFDDFLYVTAENKTILSKYNYGNEDTISSNFENGKLIQNETSLTIGSDLIKPYDNYLHALNINAKYTHPKNLEENGDLYKITDDDINLKSFPIVQNDKNIKVSLNQSLYGKNSMKQFVNHKISQSILYNKLDEPEFQNLENYVKVNHDYGYISNKTVYNIQDKQFIENDSNIELKYKELSLNLGYYKSKDTPNSNNEDLESYYVKTSYNLSRDYKIGYYENYNLLEKVRNKQGISFNINDNCWNLDLRYEKEIVPSTTSSNDNSLNQEIVYMQLELKPLGGLKQKYKIDED